MSASQVCSRSCTVQQPPGKAAVLGLRSRLSVVQAVGEGGAPSTGDMARHSCWGSPRIYKKTRSALRSDLIPLHRHTVKRAKEAQMQSKTNQAQHVTVRIREAAIPEQSVFAPPTAPANTIDNVAVTWPLLIPSESATWPECYLPGQGHRSELGNLTALCAGSEGGRVGG